MTWYGRYYPPDAYPEHITEQEAYVQHIHFRKLSYKPEFCSCGKVVLKGIANVGEIRLQGFAAHESELNDQADHIVELQLIKAFLNGSQGPKMREGLGLCVGIVEILNTFDVNGQRLSARDNGRKRDFIAAKIAWDDKGKAFQKRSPWFKYRTKMKDVLADYAEIKCTGGAEFVKYVSNLGGYPEL